MGFASDFQDSRLVRRSLAGDSAAFAELVRRHMPAVAAVALAYTRNHADADDVAQEAFLKAWQSLDTLREPRRFGGWVVTIARNVARARHNQFRRESETLKQFGLEAAMHPTRESNDSENNLHELLSGLLAELPESDQELVLLHYYGGKKTREVAELLALSHDVVRKRLERIRHKLGQTLLASLEPGSEEKARRERRAARVASAVVALPVPWKNAAAGGGAGAAVGASALFKAALFAVLSVPLAVAGVRGFYREAPGPLLAESAPPRQIQREGLHLDVPPIPEAGHGTVDALPKGETMAVISGRLLEADTGNGVAGGGIYLNSAALKDSITAITDAQGAYKFVDLPPGSYSLHLNWDEFFVQRYPRSRYKYQERKIGIEPGAALSGIDFNVVRGLDVRGQVVDPMGNPLAGALLQGWSVPNTVEATITTDSDGRFLFTGFGTDQPAFFWPRHPGLAMPPHGPVTIPPEGVDELVLAMRDESVMSGRLVDQFGRPLPGVRVIPQPIDVNSLPEEFSDTTGDAGEFSLSGLHASRYRFTIGLTGGLDYVRLKDIDDIDLTEGEQLRDIELIYEVPGELSISGHIADDTGAPQRGILVWAERETVNRRTESDATGFYKLPNLAPGVYTVTAQGISRIGPAWRTLEAEAGAADADFVLPRNGTVRGTVADAGTGEAITSFQVTANPGMQQWDEFQNAEGRYEIRSVPPGICSIWARAEGYAAGNSNASTLSPGETLEGIVIGLERAGAVSVRVSGPDGGPIRDAYVGIDDGISGFDVASRRTDAGGEFVIRDARAGLKTVRAFHPDFAPGSVQANIRAGEQILAEIQLTRGASLRGSVTRNGETLEGARVELEQRLGENSIGYNSDASTSANGTYEFKGIPEGELTLRINPMFGTQGRVFESPVPFAGSEAKVVNIALEEGAAGAVFDAKLDTEMIARDGTVWVEIEYALDSGGIERFYTSASVGSEIRIEGLRPGIATLRARYHAPGPSEVLSEIEPREVVIEDGGENRVEIDFSSPG